ncbi:MAG: hypothetical protein [Bacteriophage sp.]|nr:MAG: hypothetical protein [Bacteriophage sp.]
MTKGYYETDTEFRSLCENERFHIMINGCTGPVLWRKISTNTAQAGLSTSLMPAKMIVRPWRGGTITPPHRM